ncbi:MAG: DNA topoisomerase I [Candidatus Bathyarchaeota archaeon]|nr:DNA topoisomerase I [Candidatus Bathyarchaeota archaeon]
MQGYTLIIAEKPAAAERIAEALDRNGAPRRLREGRVRYFEAERERKILVVPALGHLYTVAQLEGKKSHYPVFDFSWQPRHLVEKKAQWSKAWIETISNLALDADLFVDACDYDIEGSLIGYSILEYACGKASVARRMKYSTLTKAELEEAYKHLLPRLEFGLIEAGKVRHEIDWLYGINLSRALTLSIKRVKGGYAQLSTGRVQGPTLRFLVTREEAIDCFVPLPYWTIKAQVEIRGKLYEAVYEKKRIDRKEETEVIIKACKERTGRITKIERRIFRQPPPLPFDFSTLQGEAYRLFGFSPRLTGNIAEKLYLRTLISYPRTSSQKLPSTINYRSILTMLGRSQTYRKSTLELLNLGSLKPREGRKEDPAHPAIYPTGNLPKGRLRTRERKLWDLIVKRFMSVFAESATKESVQVEIGVNGWTFYMLGRRVLNEGWLRFYKPYVTLDELLLPEVIEGEKVMIRNVTCESKFTRSPSRYNPGSLLRKMEKEGIGTKVTRAAVMQTLYSRGYIREENIEVTELGETVTSILLEHAPTIVSVGFTRRLEAKMKLVQEDAEKRDEVLKETTDKLRPVLEKMRENTTSIGHALGEAVKQSKLREITISKCPACEAGNLVILRSRKTGKRFIGCTNYFKNKCKTSFPLPQTGIIKSTGRTCGACGKPVVLVLKKRKRPWTLCIDPACPAKRGKK